MPTTAEPLGATDSPLMARRTAANTVTRTVMGKQSPNPFLVQNMRNAATALNKPTAGINATHKYVRYLPTKVSQIRSIEAEGYILIDRPLDHEIIAMGDSYHDPALPNDKLTYQYAVIPMDKPIPTFAPFTVLYEIHQTRDAVLEKKSFELLGLQRSSQHASTQTVDNCGGVLGGWDRDYRPGGRATVWDTERRDWVPGQWITVVATSWFLVSSAQSERDGSFQVPDDFMRCCDIEVRYENDRACFFGYRNDEFRTDFRLRFYVEEFCCSAAEDIDLQHYPTAGNTSAYEVWTAATIMNAVIDFRDHAGALEIADVPYGMNIWLSNADGSTAASAPCLNFIQGNFNYLTLGLQIGAIFIAPNINMPGSGITGGLLTGFLADVISDALPTCTFGWTPEDAHTDRITQTAYHEFGHVTHFERAGENWWVRYINYIVANEGYGNGTAQGAAQCALAESWAEHVGVTCIEHRNGVIHSNIPAWQPANDPMVINRYTWQGQLEHFRPLNPSYSGGSNDVSIGGTSQGGLYIGNSWIPYGIYLDIEDDNNQNVNGISENGRVFDESRLLSTDRFYRALEPDVYTPQQFRVRLNNQNSLAPSESIDIDNVFKSYNYL